MTVLRDAGAAAIYGTNAANGVVLITTKRGQAGQPMKLEYTGSVSASTITRVPSMLNAEQFRAAVEQFAPEAADASCRTRTPTGTTPSTGRDSARSTTSRCRGRDHE